MSDPGPGTSIFRHELVVTAAAIDGNQHVNNVAYVQWMQDAAISHSDAVVDSTVLPRLGCMWVARSHQIEYLSPAYAGDHIEITTWLDGWSRVQCRRNYRFVRTSDAKLLATGQTGWVLVNAETGRPCFIPDEIRALFLVPADQH